MWLRCGLTALCLMSLGCFDKAWNLVAVTGVRTARKPVLPAPTPDVIELHYIFIERELGNDVINTKIWSEADEQIVSMDLKEKWNSNGLRVGKLGPKLSSEMMALMKSANDAKQGFRHQTHSGSMLKVQLTDVVEKLKLFTFSGATAKGEEIPDAQGYVLITPAIHESEGTDLSILPSIEFGQRQKRTVPTADLTGWQNKNERENTLFTDLKLDVNISSGDNLLIGCRVDRKGTLGHSLFTKTVNGKVMQTVLLVRVLRPSRDDLMTAGYNLDDFFLTPIPNSSEKSRRSTVAETVRASRGRSTASASPN